VAHAYNPSYSGGRDLEDRGSKPARANSLRALVSKKPITKNCAGGVAQALVPPKKKKKERKKEKLSVQYGYV
jgi:hypothetical protein